MGVTKRVWRKENKTEDELQIVLVEYGHQQDKLKSSRDIVNQSLTLYLGLFAFLVPVAASALAVGLFGSRDIALILTGICALACFASVFTLMRTYQARIEQTDAEKALSRLRNYILHEHPRLANYFSGPIHDDWRTPYTHRWASASFWGWLALALGAGAFAALSALAFTAFAFPSVLPAIWWMVSLPPGVFIFLVCYRWLDRKLKYRTVLDVPRFPHKETGGTSDKIEDKRK